jgi:hypothetical protein
MVNYAYDDDMASREMRFADTGVPEIADDVRRVVE